MEGAFMFFVIVVAVLSLMDGYIQAWDTKGSDPFVSFRRFLRFFR